jgi:hypothetical protein
VWLAWITLIILAGRKGIIINMIKASHPAANWSWVDPVEHCMSILNLGLNASAYARLLGAAPFKQTVGQCDSMDAIRAAARADPKFEEQWCESMKGPIDQMCSCIRKMQWTGENIKCPDAATVELMAELDAVIKEIDPSVDLSGKNLTWASIKKSPVMEKVISAHFKMPCDYLLEGTIKVDGCDCKCCTEKMWPEWRLQKPVPPTPLPRKRQTIIDGGDKVERWIPYDELKGMTISNQDQPSLKELMLQDPVAVRHGMFKHSKQVRRRIVCSVCNKKRLIDLVEEGHQTKCRVLTCGHQCSQVSDTRPVPVWELPIPRRPSLLRNVLHQDQPSLPRSNRASVLHVSHVHQGLASDLCMVRQRA